MHGLKECLKDKNIRNIMNAQFAVAKDDMSRFPPVADHYFLKGVILSHLQTNKTCLWKKNTINRQQTKISFILRDWVHNTLRPKIIALIIIIIIFYMVFCLQFSLFLDLPINLLLRGEFNQVGISAIIGVTQNEGAFFVMPIKGMYTIQCIFNDLFHITIICLSQSTQELFKSNIVLVAHLQPLNWKWKPVWNK